MAHVDCVEGGCSTHRWLAETLHRAGKWVGQILRSRVVAAVETMVGGFSYRGGDSE